MYRYILFTAQIMLGFALTAQAVPFSALSDGAFQGGTGLYARQASEKPSQAVAQRKLVKFKVVDKKILEDFVNRSVKQIKQVASSAQYTPQQKLDYIKKTVQTVADYRAHNWSRSSYAEHQMDLTIKPFESFPTANGFNGRNCEIYQHKVILDWEPGAQDMRPGHRGVAEALAVLKRICRS